MVSAAILAGGAARRMQGADKGALVVGDARIVDRQLAALRAVAALIDDIRIVAGRHASGEDTRYAGLGVPVVADSMPGAGPLGGLYTALEDARHDTVIVLACDLPFVTAALLERLAIEAGTGQEIDAVVPRTERGIEPLCAAYATRCAGIVRTRILRHDFRMADLIAELRVRELGPGILAKYDDGSLFDNVNTPHDYARARGRVALDEKPSEDRITE
jgi:molybdopterin-guanine dinucleotide biosynthesis protein A